MIRIPLLAALAAAALTPATAMAAPPWSAPAPVPGAPQTSPVLAFPAGGSGLLAWTDPTQGLRGATTSSGSTLSEDGSMTAARRISGRFGVFTAEGYGNGRVVAAGDRVVRGIATASLAFGRTTGALDAVHAFRIGRRSRVASLDVNARGDVALLVIACPDDRCRSAIPYLVTRRAGGRVGKPIRLARRARTTSGAVGVNARGDAVAAWETPRRGLTGTRRILARIRTAGGRLGRTQTLGDAVPYVTLQAAIGDGRKAAVAWLGQRVGEGHLHGNPEIEYATAARGGTFRAERRLEKLPVTGTGRYVDSAGVILATRSDGAFEVAWTGYAGDRYVVKAGALGATAQIVSDPTKDTILDDFASGPGVRGVIVMREGIGGADPRPGSGPVRGVAAVRRHDQFAFDPVEAVTEPGGYVRPLETGLDAQNRAWAAWSGFDPREPGILVSTRPIP